jgi:IS5 family transposase
VLEGETLRYHEVMKPPISACEDSQGMLFRVELRDLVDEAHPLVKLAREVDWDHFEEVFGLTYTDGVGRPGIPTRLMVALHYLKYTLDLSDAYNYCINHKKLTVPQSKQEP